MRTNCLIIKNLLVLLFVLISTASYAQSLFEELEIVKFKEIVAEELTKFDKKLSELLNKHGDLDEKNPNGVKFKSEKDKEEFYKAQGTLAAAEIKGLKVPTVNFNDLDGKIAPDVLGQLLDFIILK